MIYILSFLALFVLGVVLMRRIRNVQVFGYIIFKINSRVGLSLIEKISRYSRLWRAVGDLAVVVLFGAIGSAFVAYNTKRRRVLLSALSFLTSFVYLSSSIISVFPFSLILRPTAISVLSSLLVLLLFYRYSPALSRRNATILSFLLSLLFFSSPYILLFLSSGNISSLLIGISMGVIGLPAFVILNLGAHAVSILAGASHEPGINVGYPSVEGNTPVLKYAGTNISIPIFPDILLALSILLVLHEGFHGFLSRAQGIPIRNTGLLFASIIPLGAFVEPDEKRFKASPLLSRIRVYAVGSFSNIFVVALVAFLLANAMVSSGMVEPQGFIVSFVVPGSPAAEVLHPGETIYSVDGEKTPTFDRFADIMASKSPGDNITLATKNRTISLTLAESPHNRSIGFAGVGRYVDPIVMMLSPSLSGSELGGSGLRLFDLLKWIFFLNLMLGLINLLPMKPLDGGYIYDGFFEWLEEAVPSLSRIHTARIFSQGFMILILLIFILNLLPYLF